MSETLTKMAAAIAKGNALHAMVAEVAGEVARAEAKWPPMNSAHEAYAVLLEEVDELWEHVKTKQSKRDIPAMRKEALQVAAMAIRFARDICDGGRGRA
ncbi:hypothetical protein [Roseomonas xinghualingensis]|uniref:hypothetical protein n=1 Tax=Roseomonas xinghualingensis TaxID=2986475 RepID=UPI0021F1723C|nr:hypothetical protein [Roseomonas sp. SXEYE001]MCV4207541.1 hypothetical protein [Roseomonas sp. SXEYE001]